MTVRRRILPIAALAALTLPLVGCVPVDRVAARLNADGSLDFASCEAFGATTFEVQWGVDGHPASVDSATRVADPVQEGNVLHLDATAPSGAWDWVTVDSVDDVETGGLSGQFRAEDLAGGDWAWNQTGIFIGTVDVAHCDISDGSVIRDP